MTKTMQEPGGAMLAAADNLFGVIALAVSGVLGIVGGVVTAVVKNRWERDRKSIDDSAVMRQQLIDELRREVNELKADRTAERATVAMQNATIATQNSQIANFERLLSVATYEKKELTRQMEEMRLAHAKEISELKAENAQQASQIADLRGHVGKMENQLNPRASVQT